MIVHPTKYFVILIYLLLLSAAQVVHAQQPVGSIGGTIIDASTRQPIPYANVLLVNTTRGSAADLEGNFSIENVPVGTYVLQISSIGYSPIQVSDVVVRSGRTTQVYKSLEVSFFESEEVVVEGGVYFENDTQNLTSAQNLSYEEIRRSAGAIGDVLRLTQALPGVALTNDQRNDLVVRGGSPSENLILVDNIEIPSLNHFGAQNTSGGPISMLNTEFIDDASFFSGGFSSQYGNRLSSVLDVSLREGGSERLQSDIEMGIAGFGLISEGPLTDKGSFMVSVRRSYLELLEDAIGLTAVPEYWNLNAKAVYKPSYKHTLSLISIGGIDDISFNVDPTDLDDPSLENTDSGGWSLVTGINWEHLIGKRTFGVLTVSDATYHYDTEIIDERINNQLTFRQDDTESTTTLRYELAMFPEQVGEIRAGVDAKFLRAEFKLTQPLGVLNPLLVDSSRVNAVDITNDPSTSQLSSFVEFSPRISPRVTLNLGGRYDYFEFIDETRFSPRASLRYQLAEQVNLNLSWGQYYQSPALIFLNADPVNRDLKPMRADHYIAGLSFFPAEDIRVTVEGYIKEYQDYPVSIEYPTLTLANTGDDFGVNTLLFPLVSEGSGESVGIEVYAQKKLTDSFYGQISYSYSETQHEALDGIRRKASFDIPHTFTILGGYRLGDWEFSGKFTYASGRPYTPYLEAESFEQNRAVFDLSRINSERSPEYHRLDVRVDRRFNYDNWSLLVFMDILNVYNRENVQQFIWNPKTRSRDFIPQYALIPNIGFNVKF